MPSMPAQVRDIHVSVLDTKPVQLDGLLARTAYRVTQPHTRLIAHQPASGRLVACTPHADIFHSYASHASTSKAGKTAEIVR